MTIRKGYLTNVGDAGIKLSGGQRQRLAIARSIVKQPKILILDEATSAIDVRGEKIVQAALDKVSRDRTTIMIAHRLSTIMKADNIVVLKKGQVVQQGTHEQLMSEKEGPYCGLASAQQLSLVEEARESSKVMDPEKKAVDSAAFEDIRLDREEPKNMEAEEIEMLGSFGLLLWEQRPQWMWYSLMVLGALASGGELTISLKYTRNRLTFISCLSSTCIPVRKAHLSLQLLWSIPT